MIHVQNNDWQKNTVAELIHGPYDGVEVILPPGDPQVEVIEVPVTHWAAPATILRLNVYQRDGGTLRLHTGAPATVKFSYQETRDDKEAVE